ncbi:hypothetical protein [Lysobacter gummosus]|uniref:hypothetical protein n=1 Tax=Lysobacter gummosus TaxID=262324 RepID=UPI003635C6B2
MGAALFTSSLRRVGLSAITPGRVIPAKAGSALLRRSRTSRAFSVIFQNVIPANAGIQCLSCEDV